jgi:hypothetical protein
MSLARRHHQQLAAYFLTIITSNCMHTVLPQHFTIGSITIPHSPSKKGGLYQINPKPYLFGPFRNRVPVPQTNYGQSSRAPRTNSTPDDTNISGCSGNYVGGRYYTTIQHHDKQTKIAMDKRPKQPLVYPFWLGGSSSCMAAILTHPLYVYTNVPLYNEVGRIGR